MTEPVLDQVHEVPHRLTFLCEPRHLRGREPDVEGPLDGDQELDVRDGIPAVDLRRLHGQRQYELVVSQHLPEDLLEFSQLRHPCERDDAPWRRGSSTAMEGASRARRPAPIRPTGAAILAPAALWSHHEA